MAYITKAQARAAARVRFGTLGLLEADLRSVRKTATNTTFDIFLSHSSEDASVIAGVKARLEDEGLRVYVDWLDDPQLDRSRVSRETARQLRTRMDHCRYLLYASSDVSPRSRWMPWELGYFDGQHTDEKIGILPIVETPGDQFRGQEYLQLYRIIEEISFAGYGRRLGNYTDLTRGVLLTQLVAT